MVKAMDEWLKEPKTERLFWRTTYELIAKNYYVDVDTAIEGTEDENAKEKKIIADMMNKGSFQCSIVQRKNLFKVCFPNNRVYTATDIYS